MAAMVSPQTATGIHPAVCSMARLCFPHSPSTEAERQHNKHEPLIHSFRGTDSEDFRQSMSKTKLVFLCRVMLY